MNNTDRIIPELPSKEKQLRVIIDTDFANELDDLYAVALAIATPERFKIEGFIATHFNNSCPGPKSIQKSYDLLSEFLEIAGASGKYTIKKSADPISYYGYPSEGEGVDFIIERAHASTENDPLWVVGLGAATNLASAILKDPTIIPKVRYVFHSRSEYSWPERSKQFNVMGDIHAARTLLAKNVPLVWFDTGTNIRCSVDYDKNFIGTLEPVGAYLHNYRMNHPWKECQTDSKGFYDLGDIVWMIAPEIGTSEIIPAPTMDQFMFFDHTKTVGQMLRVYDIDNAATWDIFHKNLKRYCEALTK